MTGGVARFLTLNLWGENGPWEARSRSSTKRLDALAPDVIGLQEVREVPERVPNQAALLARARGWHHAFAPTSGWGGGQRGAGDRLALPDRRPGVPPAAAQHGDGRAGILSARLDGEAGGALGPHHAPFVPRARRPLARGAGAVRRRGADQARQRQPAGRHGRLQHRPRERRAALARAGSTRSAAAASPIRMPGPPSVRTTPDTPGRAPTTTPRRCTGCVATAGSTTSS